MFRALASPATGELMLAPPRAVDDVLAACAYWTPLLHLFLFSFGWARPDLGLRWWYESGKPTDDARLLLVREVWDADGQLDWFAAWLWSDHSPTSFPLDEFRSRSQVRGQVEVEARWIAEQDRVAQASGIPNPISGGGNPLHLTTHCRGPVERADADSVLVRTSRSARLAVLALEGMRGWYRALTEQGGTLPDLGDRSWHVDVFARPTAWLGTYRRSRRTGLWFSGRHQLHERGNDL
jgi:hypothetical protein